MNRILQIRILTLIFILLFLACPDPPIEDDRDTTITLEELNTRCTDTRLKIAVEDTTGEWAFDLTRNDSLIMTKTVYQRDTTIHDSGLAINTTYNYKVYWRDVFQRKDSSETVFITTLDTTNSTFIWEIDSLGIYGSCVNDVAIVNENEIWAVGGFSIPDSTWIGPGYCNYNAARWDGNEWEFMTIIFAIYYSSDPIYIDSGEIKSIFYLESTNTLYFTWNGGLTLYNNLSEWEYAELNPDYGVPSRTIWGNSPDNMYFGGWRGNLLHFDGDTYTPVNIDYDTDFRDIVGTPDGGHIFATGVSHHNATDVVLYSNGDPHYWEVIPFPYETESPYEFPETWSLGIYEDEIYMATNKDGIMIYNFITRESSLYYDDVIYRYTRIFKFTNIVSSNDMFFGGSRMDYVHYNGLTFNYVNEMITTLPGGRIASGDYKNGVAVMGGKYGAWSFGLVLRGYRID